MSGNTPKTVYSINPAAWQFWLTVATLAALYFSMTSWIVGREFDQRLNQFHAIAKPQIFKVIDDKVSAHARLPAHGVVLEEIAAVKIRNAASDARWIALNETLTGMKASQAEMDKKIDRLLERK